jgi:cobalt/nickel transport system permease protein
MTRIDAGASEIGWLDQLASRDTPLRRVDPRIKLLTTLLYIALVVSYGRYELVPLLPLAAYPLILAAMGDVPARFIFRKLLIASPFAIFVGMFNPLLDRQPIVLFGHVAVAGGWISFASILLRFALTVSATLVLIAGTGMHDLCRGMQRLGVPSVFTVQVLMLHRYLFVLVDDGQRMVRARALRAVGGQGMGLRVYAAMLGSLLLRTLDRAQRIHVAMRCRGFDGQVRSMQTLRLRAADIGFFVCWSAVLLSFRLLGVADVLGNLLSTGAR